MIGEGPEKREKNLQREKALLEMYRASDDRGKNTIMRAAESESKYKVEPDSKTRNIA